MIWTSLLLGIVQGCATGSVRPGIYINPTIDEKLENGCMSTTRRLMNWSKRYQKGKAAIKEVTLA
jgi:hypothetical protein